MVLSHVLDDRNKHNLPRLAILQTSRLVNYEARSILSKTNLQINFSPPPYLPAPWSLIDPNDPKDRKAVMSARKYFRHFGTITIGIHLQLNETPFPPWADAYSSIENEHSCLCLESLALAKILRLRMLNGSILNPRSPRWWPAVRLDLTIGPWNCTDRFRVKLEGDVKVLYALDFLLGQRGLMQFGLHAGPRAAVEDFLYQYDSHWALGWKEGEIVALKLDDFKLSWT